MQKNYAGIGSRKTPPDVLEQMTKIALNLNRYNYMLRSGGAIGADQAFEKGAGNSKYIYTISDATDALLEHASKFHPAWNKCSEYAKRLHARNSAIILGLNLNNPVEFVICWTPSGISMGGTGQAIRIAFSHKIPVFNLFYPKVFSLLEHKLGIKL